MAYNKFKAWPHQQYDGRSTENYEDYETDFEARCISKKYEEHLSSEDPKQPPRFEVEYTVPEGVPNDPCGLPGTVVSAEAAVQYRRRLQRDADVPKITWVEAIAWRGAGI